MNLFLQRSRQLLAKLVIKDRELNTSVPFILNRNQARAHEILERHYEEHKWIRAIVLKSRRVGMSSYIDGLAFTHCLARPQAHALIAAHLKETSQKGLFRVPKDLAVALNRKSDCVDVRASQLIFKHSAGDSYLDLATAGSVGGGRGLTLTFLHLSEAAQYPGADSFLGMLPAVSKAPDTAVVLESTAFGRVGMGQTFYEFWNRANTRGNKWNGYVPIFLSWLDDPACIRPDHEARDAPASDFERDLMKKPFNCTKAQIAWMRMVLEGECDGSEQKFNQEYPHTAEVAFVSTGDPAFTSQEINYALSTKKKPIKTGRLARSGGGIVFQDDSKGKLMIWELPRPKCWYYIGVDCARGVDSSGAKMISTGDFAAIVVFNGSTGNIAARYANLVDPPTTADLVDMLGRWYTNGMLPAMVIVELTGNLGLWCNNTLRDKYLYPNLYIWKGKDDKVLGGNRGKSQGWETTSRTRDLLFSTFRGKLRDGLKRLPGGLEVYDEELVRQMDLCTMSTGMRWEVEYGHDDILMAAMMSVIACSQYPPPNIMSMTGNVLDKDRTSSALAKLKAQPDLQTWLKRDMAMIFKKNPQSRKSILGCV
jgi:hypothetical protein